ncbi:cathepsin K-like [Platysternon megacephalum]|uniref:Cathepsin K-like n=1 Tax=Platysternon megacephalum TaxID=55544 RepID=A0A4D9EBB0_9SAUR|nr:cathepsin K-like [Platysternon megacephalum]
MLPRRLEDLISDILKHGARSKQATRIRDFESQLQSRDSEIEKLGFKLEGLVAQNNTYVSQVGRLELKVQDLSELLAKREKELLSVNNQQSESQAAIRELLMELRSSQHHQAERSSCLQTVEKLKEKLKRTKGMLRAVSKAPSRGSIATTSCSSSPVLSEEEFCCASLRVTESSETPSAPPQEACEEGSKLPMAPITTTVVSYGPGSARPLETRQELKAYTPEQSHAMGKALGPLTRDTALDWLAMLCSIPGILKEDATFLIRECMTGEDFGALPSQLQVGDVDSNLQLYEGVMTFYFSHHNLIGDIILRGNGQESGQSII